MYWRGGVLYRPLEEPPAVDSGIDSDDSARELAIELLRQQEYFDMMEQVESSDDEPGLGYLSPGSPKQSRNRECEDPVLKKPELYNKFIQSLKRRGSCEELALQQNWVKRKLYGDPMENIEEGRAGLVPMLRHGLQLDDGNTTPGSPDRSSPPLYEVELTASDEDEDESVLELVIPLQSAKHNPVSLPTYISLFCPIFCCFLHD